MLKTKHEGVQIIDWLQENEGCLANGDAEPPDLLLMLKTRHEGAYYLFELLICYRETPEGVGFTKGLYYNPYFPGGAIAMIK